MKIKQTTFVLCSGAFVFLCFNALVISKANAAVLSLVPDAKNVGVGQEFNINIKVTNTGDTGINATQALIKFPNDKLTLVSVDRKDSVFNFWVEEPVISSEDGTLHFIGGASKGLFDKSLQILSMKFRASGVGSAELTVSDAVVTASDGKGTNVLSIIEGTTITVGTKTTSSAPASPEAPPVEQPKKVVREAVAAKNLPQKPELKVTLYPDQSVWYSQIGDVIALWNLPEDIIAVATKLDQNPNTKPQELEKELFTGKNFGILKEGVWYIHVRFKNNIGLGETSHYKISLDTTAPLPFEIEMDNLSSDNPAPEINYKTQDSLSGINEALIFIDGEGPIKSAATSTVTKLPPQKPGKHTVLVKILDYAGNSVSNGLKFEILPLPTPTIDFVTKSVVQDEAIFASGKTLPNAFVDVKITKDDKEVFVASSLSDEAGNWKITIKEPLGIGTYAMQVVSRDNRGAQSFSTEPQTIKIKRKPVVSLGIIDLGWLEIVLILTLLALSGASLFAWHYVSTKRTREAYLAIAGRDVNKLSTLLSVDMKELEDWIVSAQVNLSPRTKAEVEYRFKSLRETTEKMKKYLTQELSELE